jgi:hypothetical protein
MNFAELYEIKCLIGRTLFIGHHDWEDRIEMTVCASGSNNYMRFKADQITVNICDNNKVSVLGLIRKPLRFKHENIVATSFAIQAELVAHLAGEI